MSQPAFIPLSDNRSTVNRLSKRPNRQCPRTRRQRELRLPDVEKILSPATRVRLRCARELPRLDCGGGSFSAIAHTALLVRHASASGLLAAASEGGLHHGRAAVLGSGHSAPCDFPWRLISRQPAAVVGNYCRRRTDYF